MSNFSPELLNKIKDCSSQGMIDEVFRGISMATEEKINVLLKVMGEPIIFYSNGNPNPEQQYEALVGSFLSGIWKPDYSTFKAMRKN